MKILNNIVAGAPYAGIITKGIQCSDTNAASFSNNVAHSINGTGVIVVPNPLFAADNCFKGSNIFAYKNVKYGVQTYSNAISA